MKQIEQIIEWNKIAGNNTFSYHLGNSMLSEEFSETIIAMKTLDKVEMLDGILDMFIVGVGELHKVGYTSKQIEKALELIIDNNYSKFTKIDGKYTCEKDDAGKIVKPKGFKSVKLNEC